MATAWKKGRGKLGLLQPLLGRWKATAETPMGPMHCTREFTEVLGGKYVELRARWTCAPLPSPKSGAGEPTAAESAAAAMRAKYAGQP